MNRRSFFRSLALIGAAVSASPHIFIPKFEPVKWKVITPAITPGWFIAEFKQAIAPDYSAFTHMIFHKRDMSKPFEPCNDDGKFLKTDGINHAFVGAPNRIVGWGDKEFLSQFKRDPEWTITFPLEPSGESG